MLHVKKWVKISKQYWNNGGAAGAGLSIYPANISNFHLSNFEKLKHLTQIGRRRGGSKQ